MLGTGSLSGTSIKGLNMSSPREKGFPGSLEQSYRKNEVNRKGMNSR